MELYKKYRPATLDEMVGNEDVVCALKNMLSKDEAPHTYLFHGPSGCGKTTLARILSKELGCAEADYREVDTADFRGIDTAREIRKQIRYAPLEGSCKVWLLDECFAPGTMVQTTRGDVAIEDIKVGDEVFNMHGMDRVTHTHTKQIPLERLVKVKCTDGSVLFCSDGHEFFTNRGWIRARYLQNTDLLYTSISGNVVSNKTTPDKEVLHGADEEVLSLVQKGNETFPKSGREVSKTVLQSKLSGEAQIKSAGDTRSVIQQRNEKETQESSTDISQNKESRNNTQEIFSTNVEEQPDVCAGKHRKNEENKREEWNSSHLEGRAGRKWNSDERTDIGSFGVAMENRSCCSNKKKATVSACIQNRCCEPQVENRNRNRRTWAQIEKEYVERQKEAGTAGIVGVDYIEIYQQGSNNEHFSSVVGNKECVCGTITLYDLSVETHPSFYANGIMVHNCHKMTNDAQNGLLKALEDTPAHVYFILATTEPEKLLKTIRGRCSQFQVDILDDAQMFKLLRHVVKSEGAKLSKNIYEQIIEDSLGHCRDALQILEQVLNADPDKRLAIAKRAAELQSQTIELCRALMGNAPWKKVASILQGLKTQDPESIRRAVLGYCNAVLLKGTNNQAAIIMEEFIEPFYNTGFPGLTFACYSIVNGE